MPILLENVRYLRVSALPSHDQTQRFLSKFTRVLSKVEIFKNGRFIVLVQVRKNEDFRNRWHNSEAWYTCKLEIGGKTRVSLALIREQPGDENVSRRTRCKKRYCGNGAVEAKFFENEIYADRASHAKTLHISIILRCLMFGTAGLLQFEWSLHRFSQIQKLELVYTA